MHPRASLFDSPVFAFGTLAAAELLSWSVYNQYRVNRYGAEILLVPILAVFSVPPEHNPSVDGTVEVVWS